MDPTQQQQEQQPVGSDGEVPKRAHLYVGNLSARVTEYMLTEIFAVAGPVQNVKIIPDRNYQHGGLNYGFVEYMDMRAAETALQTLNGRKIFDTEIKVNWAYQGQQNKEDTQGHFHVFVGDLSPEVNDEVLQKAFGAFGTLSDARVMWDMSSGKSRGYGFLAFRDKTDAEQAIATMNGEWLGSRAIRVNWANQKTQTGGAGSMGASAAPRTGGAGGAPAPINFQGGPLSYDVVVAQTPAFNSTVYVGNLIPYTTQADLIPLFQGYGYIVEIRMQADRGFAFVKLDSHENAAMAIVQLQGQLVHGRPVKCSWGKDRMSTGQDGGQPGGGMGGQQPGGQMPQYGMPPAMYGMPPNAYGQYPFAAGYGGFQQPGAPAAPGQADQSGQDPAAIAYYQQMLQQQQQMAAAAGQGAPGAGGAPQQGGAAAGQAGGWGDFYGGAQQQGAPQQ